MVRCLKLESKEQEQLYYLEDLSEEFSNVVELLCFNVITGVVHNLGIKNPDEIKTDKELFKSFLGDFNKLPKKIKGYFLRKFNKSVYTPFELKNIKIDLKRHMTPDEYREIDKQIKQYLEPYLNRLAEESAVKSSALSLYSLLKESERSPVKTYGKKTFEEVEASTFFGYVPDTYGEFDSRLNADRYQLKALTNSYTRMAQYVKKVDEDTRSMIANQVRLGAMNEITPMELSSNLYWGAKDYIKANPELSDDTLLSTKRDWRRVAYTELAMYHESMKAGTLEGEAEDHPVYFVFTGGTCDFCGPREGTIVRLIPTSLIGDTTNDSLSARGIKDPYTNIAHWSGKNNVGFKKAKWRVCTPAHPYGRAVMTRFFPDSEVWNDTLRIPEIKKIPEKKNDKLDEIFDDFYKQLNDTLSSSQNKAEAIRSQKEADYKNGIYKKEKEYYPDWVGSRKQKK